MESKRMFFVSFAVSTFSFNDSIVGQEYKWCLQLPIQNFILFLIFKGEYTPLIFKGEYTPLIFKGEDTP